MCEGVGGEGVWFRFGAGWKAIVELGIHARTNKEQGGVGRVSGGETQCRATVIDCKYINNAQARFIACWKRRSGCRQIGMGTQ